MKPTIHLTIFLLTCAPFLSAQVLNPGFEEWYYDSVILKNVPLYWSTNDLALTNYVTRTQDAHEGSYAASVNTAPFGIAGTFISGGLVNGKLSQSAVQAIDIIGAGTPICSMPYGLEGFFKYSVGPLLGPDSGYVFVILKKYNAAQGTRDTIAIGSAWLNIEANYTPFTVNLNYWKTGVYPDSIVVGIFSSGQPFPNNISNLRIDGLMLQDTSTAGLPAIAVQPIGGSYVSGDSASLSVKAFCADEYAWFKDGIQIPGAHGSTMNLHPVKKSDMGYYHCWVGNQTGSVSTDMVFIEVTDPTFVLRPKRNSGVSVYPNPVRQEPGAVISILYGDGFNGDMQPKLFGMTGQLIPVITEASSASGELRLRLPQNLSGGIYFLVPDGGLNEESPVKIVVF